MVRLRRGASNLGCLLTLLVLAAVAYFGVPIGEAYWRYYRFQDEMRQAARLAKVNPDDVIRSRLTSFVEQAGLPAEARRVAIRRLSSSRISISVSYEEVLELPGMVRVHRFSPAIEEAY